MTGHNLPTGLTVDTQPWLNFMTRTSPRGYSHPSPETTTAPPPVVGAREHSYQGCSWVPTSEEKPPWLLLFWVMVVKEFVKGEVVLLLEGQLP